VPSASSSITGLILPWSVVCASSNGSHGGGLRAHGKGEMNPMWHQMCVVGGGSKAQVAELRNEQACLEQRGRSHLFTLVVCDSANGGRALSRRKSAGVGEGAANLMHSLM